LNRIRASLIALFALLLAAGLAACGGDGGGDEDPAQVLEQGFAQGKEFPSGVLDITLNASAEGEQGGSFEASLSGPFQSQGEGQVPLFDLTADVSGEAQDQSISFSGGLTSTGDKAFVNYQDTEYEVDPQTFQSFSSLFSSVQQQSAAQQTEGPTADQISQYLTNLENEGDEDVEGTETTHIVGNLNVDSVSEAIQGIAGQTGQVDPAQLEQFKETVEEAEFNFYIGKDDDRLRKFETNLALSLPEDQGGAVDLDFAVTLSDLDQPQEIAAPTGAKPLSELLGQFGLDPSQINQAIQQGVQGSPLGGGAGAAPPTGDDAGTGVSPTPPSTGASQAYLECLQQAQGDEALQACSALLE
jgi:hypothetical protein